MSTWLYRIVTNRAADLATRRGAVPIDVEALPDHELFGFEVPGPEQVLEKAADEASLRAALSRLNPIDRMMLVLHDGEGWGAREIGEATGIATANAHKRIQRGRFRLARELGADLGPVPSSVEGCLHARSLAPDYLDGSLDAQAKEVVEAHLRECELCPPLAQAVIGLREALEKGASSTSIHEQTVRFLRVLTDGEL